MIIIDRIEGDMAVLEIEGATYHVPASALPDGASEGSALRLTLEPATRASREAQAKARLERLKKRGQSSGGKLEL